MADTTLIQKYRERATQQEKTLAPILVTTMSSLMPQIPNLLPADLTVEQFRSALFLELSGRPDLAKCTSQSLRDCTIKAAMYGLLPGKHCHILPFKNRKGGNVQATFVPNYFGVSLSLERTGKVKRAIAHPVYEGDEFRLDYLADDVYSHIPYMVLGRKPGAIRFYYGAVLMKDGTKHIEVMSLEQIDAIRKRAPAHDDGPWVTDKVEMSRKTALKHCAKYVNLTPQVKEMLEADDERELEDIAPERHADNINALFGDQQPGASTPQVTPAADSMWRDTVEAHWREMPEPLRSDCAAALLPDADVTESDGFALASAILDYLDGQENGGGK